MVPPKRPTEGSHLLPWLSGIAAVLALVLLWDHQSDTAPAEGTSAPTMATQDVGSSTRQPGPNPLARLGLNSLRDTVGRPLFERSRRTVEPIRKIEAPPPPVAQRAPDEAALTLLGVLKSEGKAVALLKRNQTGQNVRAEEGDTIDGWTVKQIEYRRVVLSQGGREIALQMFIKPRR
jgi:hypothetical protein